MKKYIDKEIVMKVSVVSGVVAVAQGVMNLLVALIPFLVFLSCFVSPLLCIIGLAIPAWAAYYVTKEKGYNKETIADALIASALVGAVTGLVSSVIAVVFSVISTVAGIGSTAAMSSLSGVGLDSVDVATGAGAGIVGTLLCSPITIIGGMLVSAVVAAIFGAIFALLKDPAKKA